MKKNRAIKICNCNNKGGVGKTTTTVALAGILAELGKKVLVTDADPQGNSSQSFGQYGNGKKIILDLFNISASELTKESVKKCITQTAYKNIDMIPSNPDFSFIEEDLAVDVTRIRQYILKNALSKVEDEYDYIIIDTAPFYNIISINALSASDYFLTPVEADGYGYQGLLQLLKRVTKLQGELNPDLEFLGVFLTRGQIYNSSFKDLYESYTEGIGEHFIPVYIPHRKEVAESTIEFVPITEYVKSGKINHDYKKLLAEINVLDEETQVKLVRELVPVYLDDIAQCNTAHVSEMLDSNFKRILPTLPEKDQKKAESLLSEVYEKRSQGTCNPDALLTILKKWKN